MKQYITFSNVRLKLIENKETRIFYEHAKFKNFWIKLPGGKEN